MAQSFTWTYNNENVRAMMEKIVPMPTEGVLKIPDRVPTRTVPRGRIRFDERPRSLGSGNFGYVLEAHFNDSENYEQTVAVKFLNRRPPFEEIDESDSGDVKTEKMARNQKLLEGIAISKKQFENEAMIMSKIPAHQNVIYFYGLVQYEGFQGIVIEIATTNIEKYYLQQLDSDSNWRFNRSDMYVYLSQIARGMSAVARCGIVHRDLRCENVLLVESGGEIVAKVADFGLSVFDGEERPLNEIIPGPWIDPDVYTSIHDGLLTWSLRTDVWMFAMFIIEMQTRKHPKEEINDLAKQTKNSDYRDSFFSSKLGKLVILCTDKAKRPTFQEIVDKHL